MEDIKHALKKQWHSVKEGSARNKENRSDTETARNSKAGLDMQHQVQKQYRSITSNQESQFHLLKNFIKLTIILFN